MPLVLKGGRDIRCRSLRSTLVFETSQKERAHRKRKIQITTRLQRFENMRGEVRLHWCSKNGIVDRERKSLQGHSPLLRGQPFHFVTRLCLQL